MNRLVFPRRTLETATLGLFSAVSSRLLEYGHIILHCIWNQIRQEPEKKFMIGSINLNADTDIANVDYELLKHICFPWNIFCVRSQIADDALHAFLRFEDGAVTLSDLRDGFRHIVHIQFTKLAPVCRDLESCLKSVIGNSSKVLAHIYMYVYQRKE